MIVQSKLRWSAGISIRLIWRKYGNGRDALEGVDPVTHELIVRFSVNLPDRSLEAGRMFVKEWSENEGATQTLVEAGVVKIVGSHTIDNGCVAYEVEILKRE